MPLLVGVAAAQTPLTVAPVASGFDSPIEATAPAGDRDRVFVAEQRGRVLVVRDGVVLPAPFLDLSGIVSQSGDERGLLGLAFHPEFADDGFVYASYTRESDGATEVARYAVSLADPDQVDPQTGTVVFGPLPQPFSGHNGGCIRFGADGKLYLGLGDGGFVGDPLCGAQDPTQFLGKLLRLEDDGTIPADNPFVGDASVRDEIWALGLRNPWRFSFDRATGDLFLADVGHFEWEEIVFEPFGSPGGRNYGWNVMEGPACFTGQGCASPAACQDAAYTLPLHAYDHGTGCAVIGGVVYRGCAISDLRGAYFYSDYCTGRIWSLRTDGVGVVDHVERTAELGAGGASVAFVTAFGEDGDGEILLVTRGAAPGTGEVFRLVADAPAPANDLGFGKAGGSGLAPELTACGLLDSGNSALLRLRHAPAHAPMRIFLGLSADPTPFKLGHLVPVPILLSLPETTDGEGLYSVTLPGGGGPLSLYLQMAVLDPTAAAGVALSNALEVVLQP